MKNKKALQQQLGLPVDEKKFMVGIVSRLTDQKGLDLVQGVMDELCSDDMQLVVLGTGDERYEICSAIMTGNTMTVYLPRSTILRKCLIAFMQVVMHS